MAPTFLHLALYALVLAAGAAVSAAEQHIVRFQNSCGRGTPTLIQGAKTLSTGKDFTSNGPLISAIAYLQTGQCGFNGEKCATIELTLKDPDPGSPGSGSSVDISLIPPLSLNVPVSFSYFGGCDGTGASCETNGCKSAFAKPDDTFVQVACQTKNVNVLVTFCGSGTSGKAARADTQLTNSAMTKAKATQTQIGMKTRADPTPTGSALRSAVAAASPTRGVCSVPTPNGNAVCPQRRRYARKEVSRRKVAKDNSQHKQPHGDKPSRQDKSS
ncbi:hypothetical protein K474DRAFT_1013834 [Panus rudis PR-1116 ss-1]|nr:hypothetical protein K474DRAFT_1013834 [Panus rudis PR-1116 ss-1]